MNNDRMQRQRFELKYLVDEHTALGIRNYVGAMLALDEASQDKPNNSYRVNSIYLDSARLTTFWHWVNADRNRFKLRLRFYDEKPTTPVFLEIKQRLNNCILKQRCGVHKRAVPMILNGLFPPDELILSRDAKGRSALENFIRMTAQLSARPKALVTYAREAYIDPDNVGVRVTMDREVRIAPRHSADFSLDLDHFEQPFGDRVILELKFTNRFPNWFADLVRLFGLTRSAAAKYCEGVASLWHPELGNCAPHVQTQRAAFASEPRRRMSHPRALAARIALND